MSRKLVVSANGKQLLWHGCSSHGRPLVLTLHARAAAMLLLAGWVREHLIERAYVPPHVLPHEALSLDV